MADLPGADALKAKMAEAGQPEFETVQADGVLDLVESTQVSADTKKKIRHLHDAVIDFMLANPGATKKAISTHFKRSEGWMYTVTASDAFAKRLEERREDIVDPIMRATLDDQIKGLAMKSMDVLAAALEAKPDPALALQVAEMTQKSLGYGARQSNVAVQASFVVAMPDKAPTESDWSKKYAPVNIVDAE